MRMALTRTDCGPNSAASALVIASPAARDAAVGVLLAPGDFAMIDRTFRIDPFVSVNAGAVIRARATAAMTFNSKSARHPSSVDATIGPADAWPAFETTPSSRPNSVSYTHLT